MSESEWCEELNRRVYFWVDKSRLDRLVAAYRDKPQDVLLIDAGGLFDRYEADIGLSAINTGAVAPAYMPRGTGTFQTVADCRATRNGRPDPEVAEVTCARAITDIAEITLRVVRYEDGKPHSVIWHPGLGPL